MGFTLTALLILALAVTATGTELGPVREFETPLLLTMPFSELKPVEGNIEVLESESLRLFSCEGIRIAKISVNVRKREDRPDRHTVVFHLLSLASEDKRVQIDLEVLGPDGVTLFSGSDTMNVDETEKSRSKIPMKGKVSEIDGIELSTWRITLSVLGAT